MEEEREPRQRAPPGQELQRQRKGILALILLLLLQGPVRAGRRDLSPSAGMPEQHVEMQRRPGYQTPDEPEGDLGHGW